MRQLRKSLLNDAAGLRAPYGGCSFFPSSIVTTKLGAGDHQDEFRVRYAEKRTEFPPPPNGHGPSSYAVSA